MVRPAAGLEITAAFDWYEGQSPGLGCGFLRAVDAVLASILRSPALYAVVRGRTRRALLRRFPYGVFYYERDDEVVVVAVVHSRQDPERWQVRAE